MRVNDLAKEIGRHNNELIAYLKEQGVLKTAMSNISSNEEKMLREKFNNIDGKEKVNKEIKDNIEKKSATQSGEVKKEETHKKKVVVFRPQNAQQMPAKNQARIISQERKTQRKIPKTLCKSLLQKKI